MKWSGRRDEKSWSGKAELRVETRRKCTLLLETLDTAETVAAWHVDVPRLFLVESAKA